MQASRRLLQRLASACTRSEEGIAAPKSMAPEVLTVGHRVIAAKRQKLDAEPAE
jgi:hypothetical protein